METDKSILSNDLSIDKSTLSYFNEIGDWTRSVAITGILSSSVIGLIGLTAFSYRYALSMVIGYFVFTAISLGLFILLFRFSRSIKTSIELKDQEKFSSSILELKTFFIYAAIVSIIGFVLIVLGAIGLFFAANFSR